MNLFPSNLFSLRLNLLALGLSFVFTHAAAAQTCETVDDMNATTRAALAATGKHYYDLVSKGDSVTLKQSAIASLAADFSGVENAIKDNQANLLGTQPAQRPEFLLKVEGTAPLQRAEFLCGVFGKNGQTANSAEFVIPNLSPGSYGIVMEEASTPKGPFLITFVLEQQGADWKLGGLFVKETQAAGKDSNWYADKARAFKTKGQNRNAWLYYTEARELAVPVSFMYTQVTDKLIDESQPLKPPDLPAEGSTANLVVSGSSYTLIALFPLAIGQDLDLIVKYNVPDISNSSKTFDLNMAVIKALLAKYPEFRDAFTGVVARAVDPSGKDYGTLAAMKDIK